MNYFLYARKSSDSEDRQILSIEAQIEELRDFAKQNNLEITKIFTESMSAKQPGRPVFDRMMDELDHGITHGILSWHPDRLARNTLDGGRIMYLIDQGKVKDLKFPNFYFDKTANGKFNLSIAFSQAQYFIDGLKENVNRGIRQKVRRGEFPGKAPYGYINHHKTRKIEADPEHFETMKKLLTRFASNDINYKEMREAMFNSGIRGARNNKAISFSTLHNLLTNHFYHGVFKLKGELHEGSHKPMISKETFDKIQKRIKSNSRKTNHKKAKAETEFYFPSIASCGDCGYSITFEKHKSRVKDETLKYYRCSDKKPDYKCSQRKYLREEKLAEQIKELVIKAAIPENIAQALEAKSIEWNKEENQAKLGQKEILKDQVKHIKDKLDNLLDLQLDNEISLEEYKAKKNKLISQKASIQEKIKTSETNPYGSLEQELDFLKTCTRAHKNARKNNFVEMNSVIQKIGSNRKIINQKLEMKLNKPFDFLNEFLINAESHSRHEKPYLIKLSDTQLKSGSLEKRAACSEGVSPSCASKPQACEPWETRLEAVGLSEWYPRGNLNPCCTDENRVS